MAAARGVLAEKDRKKSFSSTAAVASFGSASGRAAGNGVSASGAGAITWCCRQCISATGAGGAALYCRHSCPYASSKYCRAVMGTMKTNTTRCHVL